MSSIFNNLYTEPLVQVEQSAKKEFVEEWRRSTALRGQRGISNPHVQHVAFRAIGALAAVAAATLIVLTLSSVVIVGHYVIIPLCILTSVFSFMRAKSIQNEREESALMSIRKDITKLSLKEIAREYSWDQLFTRGILSSEEFALRYREQVAPMPLLQACRFYEKTKQRLENCPFPKYAYHIPLPGELREKWAKETENLSFDQIIDTYPIAKLHDYHILSEREYALLTELNITYQIIKNQRNIDLSTRFPQADITKKELEENVIAIESEYRRDPVVMRLEAIDSECKARHDQIINRYAQLVEREIDEAYAACREYLVEHPGHFYLLRKEHREKFQALKSAYAEKEQEINGRLERARNDEITQLEEQYRAERAQLTVAVQAVKAKRDGQIAELQLKIKDARASDEQIEQRFRNILKDLNAQFAARRYILNVNTNPKK